MSPSVRGRLWRLCCVLPLLAPGVAASPSAAQDAASSFRLGGQVGVRAEYIANESFAEHATTRDDDHRLRFRARVRGGGEYAPDRRILLGFRLSTGSAAYPSSGWSTIGNDLRRHEIALDRAYIRIAPRPGIDLRGGLDANPLFHPTELVWDSDVSPGGFAEVVRVGPVVLAAGQFMLREVRSSRPDREENAFLFAHGMSYERSSPLRLRIGAFHYAYSNPNAVATSVERGLLDGDYRTNRFHPDDPGAYFSAYRIVGAGGSLGRSAWTVDWEAAINLGARRDAARGDAYAERESLAFGATLTWGRLDAPGDWSVTAGYFQIEADAVLAPYNSDDLQQTNVRSVPVWVRVRLPGGASLIWDTYLQKKLDTGLPASGGVVHDENAPRVRTRVTLLAGF